ncbi:MAG: type II toxin-antitoxin system Phd/YefM family antitoxin [Fimbriimonadales bacterium]
MESVGSFDAKTHLAALLERVARGETIMITKHGKPVARLVPIEENGPCMSVGEAIAGLLEFRKNHALDRKEIRELVDEGRKY